MNVSFGLWQFTQYNNCKHFWFLRQLYELGVDKTQNVNLVQTFIVVRKTSSAIIYYIIEPYC